MTVAVRVTGWPVVDGFGLPTIAVLVVVFVTTCETGVALLAMKLPSPE